MLMVFQAEVLSQELDPYIRNLEGNEGPGEGGAALHKEQTRLWPLIKYVQVTLPASDFVPEGVIFVDIPGTGDSNKKRDEMWKEVTGRWDQCRGGWRGCKKSRGWWQGKETTTEPVGAATTICVPVHGH